MTRFRLSVELCVGFVLLLSCGNALRVAYMGGATSDVWRAFADCMTGGYAGLLVALAVNDREDS